MSWGAHLGWALAVWAGMVVFAVGNGFFGELVVGPRLGEYAGHLYKTVLAVVVIFIVSRYFVGYLSAQVPEGELFMRAVVTGAFWMVLSMNFEFLAGHYVFGFPWEKLLADYRIWQGRLWSLVLLAELVSPAVNVRLLGL